MDWLQRDVKPEKELQTEILARSMEPREAYLFRTLMTYQAMLQSAVHEIMRLEFELEDLKARDL
jgi:hypothetical protein